MTNAFTATGNPRSLLLAAAGAIIGLVIAGFGLFTAEGTRSSVVPADSVALVNQVPILRSDYDAQLRSLYDVSQTQATPAQRRKTIEDMIREELYVQRGVELGLPTYETEVRAALVSAAEAQAAQDALTSEPTPQDLAAFYRTHLARFATPGSMELHEFVPNSKSAADAAQAVAALRGGTALAAVVARYGLVSTGRVDDGEEFYFAARIHLGDAAFAVARTLADGAAGGPVATPLGPVVLVMVRNHPPVAQSFAEAKPRVIDDYTTDNVAKLTKANDRFLRKRAEILIAPDLR